MKKWLYFIVPSVLLLGFLFIYTSHKEEARKRTEATRALTLAKEAEEKAQKAKLEEIAREDAVKKAAEREAELAAKEAKRIAQWAEAGQKLEDETQDAIKVAKAHAAKIASLEKEIADLRQSKEQANRDFIEAARQVELSKIERRNQELEIQRLTNFLIRKAESSQLAQEAPPAATPAKG